MLVAEILGCGDFSDMYLTSLFASFSNYSFPIFEDSSVCRVGN